MFSRKGHADVKRSAAKVLDPKKDTLTRLKHLRVVLDTYDQTECKTFFENNYSQIYYIFYDVFIIAEADLKKSANKAHREEFENILFIFEKILTLLPELIHKRWQYHSIGRLMKKLLHTGNALKIRQEGMRLFLIWYQVLMDNATEECHRTYANLVPDIGSLDGLNLDVFTAKGSLEGTVSGVEVCPVLPPQSGEKTPENLPRTLLQWLLLFMVSEVTKIEWSDREMRERTFNFLFTKFKHYYLHNVFPEFKSDLSVYSPALDLPESRMLEVTENIEKAKVIPSCQEVVVKWVTMFTSSYTPGGATGARKKESTAQSQTSHSLKDDRAGEEGQGAGTGPEPLLPGSNTSTLSTMSSFTEKDSGSSSVCSEDHSVSEYEIVKRILYSSRENVDIVHEVYRQAFLLSFRHAGAMKRVINVYKGWLQEEVLPLFMREPARGGAPYLVAQKPEETPLTNHVADQIDHGSATQEEGSPKRPRQDSYSTENFPAFLGDLEQVKAGAQKVVQVFITNSANVFLLEASNDALLVDEQVDMCKRVLNIYRFMVMNHSLEQPTWEQLLQVLLRVTSIVLTRSRVLQKDSTLATRLAPHLIQTLIVTWIKANLNVHISEELWDHFLKVLSSLTGWAELIREWAKTMETLTRVLAKHVYDLDLNDLPLDRPSDKERRRRGVKTVHGKRA